MQPIGIKLGTLENPFALIGLARCSNSGTGRPKADRQSETAVSKFWIHQILRVHNKPDRRTHLRYHGSNFSVDQRGQYQTFAGLQTMGLGNTFWHPKVRIDMRAALLMLTLAISPAAAFAKPQGDTSTSDAKASSAQPNIIMVFTDDWGYGDLGVFQNLSDVKTPHLDDLAQQGVLFTDAYITAPQCSPSRAGLITGRYQQRFGFDTIPDCPLPLDQSTVADRLKSAGYVTGMVGKWHLEPNPLSVEWARKHQPDGIRGRRVNVRRELAMPYLPQGRGFDEFFMGNRSRYWCNFDLEGGDLKRGGEFVEEARFRVDVQTDAGLAFIRRNKAQPFFLYLAYYAPHVPLEAPKKYLDRFPGEMPERRRTGLAMINAVDDGVGRILKSLRDQGIADNTLIMFTSDNGAPLGAQQGQFMADILPVNKPGPAWDGSRNDPLTGEKGMLAEGGIRVPMIWSWPARLPKGKTVTEPVISLDMTASALAAAGASDRSGLDGVDLLPALTGKLEKSDERDLYWRFWNQAAIRSGDWKYIVTGGGRELLFNLRDDKEEQDNLLADQRKRATQLRKKLSQWTHQLDPPGLPSNPPNGQEIGWYEHYFRNHD